MIRIFALFLLCMCFGHANADSFAFNILGYAYEDSSRVRLETIYEEVLSKSAYLDAKVKFEKGLPRTRKSENRTGVFLLSIMLLYAFAGVRLMFSHQFAGSLDILKNLKNNNKGQTEADGISLFSFYGLFLITLGYATYNFLLGYKSMLTGLPVIAGVILCCSVVTVLFIVKIGLVGVVAWSFNKKEVLLQYFQKVSVIYKVSAIVLFPLSILFLVSSDPISALVLKLTLAIILLTMLMRYLVNLRQIKKLLSVHFFHFILYLCAFEIIPLMLLVKWLR